MKSVRLRGLVEERNGRIGAGQIRTFFYALLWVLVMGLLTITIIGIPFAWVLAIVIGIWVLYRIVRGWLALIDRKPIAA